MRASSWPNCVVPPRRLRNKRRDSCTRSSYSQQSRQRSAAILANPNPFRVLTTPGYERDFRTLSRGRASVVDAMEELLAVLRNDPYNRGGRHQIKKLTGCTAGEGQWRIRWKEYRLRYDIAENDVVLYSFRYRKDAY